MIFTNYIIKPDQQPADHRAWYRSSGRSCRREEQIDWWLTCEGTLSSWPALTDKHFKVGMQLISADNDLWVLVWSLKMFLPKIQFQSVVWGDWLSADSQQLQRCNPSQRGWKSNRHSLLEPLRQSQLRLIMSFYQLQGILLPVCQVVAA